MNSKLAIFRVFAGIVSIYHIILGLIGTFGSPEFIGSAVSKIYGVTPNLDPQFLSAARFAGSYILGFGVMMWFVSKDPNKYRLLIIPAIVMFATRIFDRLFYFGTLQDAFGLTMAQNMMTIIPVTIIAIGLIAFRPKN